MPTKGSAAVVGRASAGMRSNGSMSTEDTRSDTWWMDGEGDEQTRSFTELVRRHYAGLVDFAYGYLKSGADAEDVVQDVLLRVWARRAQTLPASSVRAYLYRAVRNRALNALRNARQNVELPSTYQGASVPSHDLQLRELARDFRAAMEELPPRQQEAYRLSRLYGLTYEEISEVMGTSVNTVRSQISAALKHFRTRLAGHL